MASRDRLAAMRAQRNPGSYQGQNPAQPAYEMQGMQQQQPAAPQQYGEAPVNGASNGIRGFQEQISSVQDMLRQYDANVARISELHSRSLNTMDENANQQTVTELDQQIADTRSLGNQIKSQIETLKKSPTPGQDARIRQNQISLVSNKFVEALQNYQRVEADYRARYKQRVERQFRIVKPDATQEEVAAVVNDERGNNEIFAQALANTNRFGESRAAYREVQERHEEIKRIEQTMGELAQLFNDMSVLIQQQDETLDQINTYTEQAAKDTEAGLQQTEKAVDSARAARRKRWICFWIFVVILIVVAIVLAVVITMNKKN